MNRFPSLVFGLEGGDQGVLHAVLLEGAAPVQRLQERRVVVHVR